MNPLLRRCFELILPPCGGVRRAVVLAVIAMAAGIFLLAWLTFGFPLTYCDSPGWAPGFLAALRDGDAQNLPSIRGWPVPLWFNALGALSIRLDAANLIGAVQAILTMAALVVVSRPFLDRPCRLEFILVPAFLASCLRYAVYSQTILSESIALALYAVVWRIVLDEKLTRLRILVAFVTAGVLVQARMDALYMVPILLLRVLTATDSGLRRLPDACMGVLLFAAAMLPGIAQKNNAAAFAKGMIVSEWVRYSVEPRNAVASALSTDLTRQLAAVTKGQAVPDIQAGLKLVRQTSATSASWPKVFGVPLYQLANDPWPVAKDRTATLLDLFAASYSSFSPGYRPWGAYAAPFRNTFHAWPLETLNGFGYSCKGFGLALAEHYRVPQVASEPAFRVLQGAAAPAGLYGDYVLRPLLWAALLAAPALLWARGDRRHALLTLIIASHLALRAILVCADERYELPIDILCIWWAAITIRQIADRLHQRNKTQTEPET